MTPGAEHDSEFVIASEMPVEAETGPGDDPRVIVAMEKYAAAMHAGRQPDRHAFLAAHADIAEELAKCLDGLEFLRTAGPCLGRSRERDADARDEIRPSAALGDYQIVGEIGRGGMGIVYEAVQLSLGRRVALKVLPFAAALDPKQLQRFKNEAQAAAQLHHTNIVPVYAVGCERGVHFYAMQYIEGQTVAALVRELRQLAGLEVRDPSASASRANALASELVSGRWAPTKAKGGEEPPTGRYVATPPPNHHTSSRPTDATPPMGLVSTDRSATSRAYFRTVAHLGVQAAEALEHAHAKGIIHRDIKPANLLIDINGNLWITDFGLARMLSEVGLTMTGDLVGTLRYMSPEQALAKRVAVDHRTDLYSLGVSLYELLTLQPAYDAPDREEVLQQIAFEEPRLPRRINKSIPVELETIIRKAMRKSPAERYATAHELADDLRRFLEDKPIRAKKPTLLDWTRKWARRHQGVVTTGIAGLIVAVGILTISTLMILSAYKRESTEKQSAVTALYHSRVREAQAIRRVKGNGYRSKVWQLLREARDLNTPENDISQLRQEAVACLGDFVGLDPITWTDFSAEVNAIALHPIGVPLAIGLSDGTVALQDLGTGKARAYLDRHSSPVTALTFAPDGRLVSGDRDGGIHIYETKANGEWALARTIIGEPLLAAFIPSAPFPSFLPHFVFPTLNSIAITPDSQQIAASLFYPVGSRSLSSIIVIWNLADGTRACRFERGQALEWISCPAFSPDGKYLTACYLRYVGEGLSLRAQQGILLWDLDRGGDPRDLPLDLGFVHKASFSPDGKLLACACDEGLAFFDTVSFQCQPFPSAERSRSIAFSSNGHLLAVANPLLGQVRLWNVTSNRDVAVLSHPGGSNDFVQAVACSSSALVAASQRAVRMWNLDGSGEKLLLSGHGKGTDYLAFSPDGKLLVSAGKDRTVKIWDSGAGKLVKQLHGFGAEVDAVSFSADGKMLATGDWAGAIQIWDVASGDRLAALTDHGLGRLIWSIAFSPDGRYFAACGGGAYRLNPGGGVALWRTQGSGTNNQAGVGLSFQRIPGPAASGALYLTFSPDSRLLALASHNAVHLWDLEECQERPFPAVHLANDWKCLAFLPGGKHLVFVSDTGVAAAWDVMTGRKAFAFDAQQSKEGTDSARLDCIIALSADGAKLAGIRGRNVTIWETASRSVSLRLPEEQSLIYSLAWSPDRERLAVGTSDGGLAIWNLPKIKAQLDEIGLGW
jgi:WD40 repeat protein/serine/threonine protein kinase